MSRVGRQPIAVPKAVQVQVTGQHLKIKGALGEIEHDVPEDLEAQYQAETNAITLTRKSETRRARAAHGLHRTLIANKVRGVMEGYSKGLEIYGTGYSANLRGNVLVLQVGFSHEVQFELPPGIKVEIEQNSAQAERPARFTIKGIDKEQVGLLAAQVRTVRPPEPYKGKGVRYVGEYVRRKEGKAFTGLER